MISYGEERHGGVVRRRQLDPGVRGEHGGVDAGLHRVGDGPGDRLGAAHGAERGGGAGVRGGVHLRELFGEAVEARILGEGVDLALEEGALVHVHVGELAHEPGADHHGRVVGDGGAGVALALEGALGVHVHRHLAGVALVVGLHVRPLAGREAAREVLLVLEGDPLVREREVELLHVRDGALQVIAGEGGVPDRHRMLAVLGGLEGGVGLGAEQCTVLVHADGFVVGVQSDREMRPAVDGGVWDRKHGFFITHT